MSTVPGDTPTTEPVVSPIVAVAVLLLVHVPAGVALLRAVVLPTHTVAVPVMAAGSGWTVTTAVRMQPVESR